MERTKGDPIISSRYVFLTERLGPMTTAGLRKTMARIGEGAKFPFPVHPHMLRHACGFKLANDGQGIDPPVTAATDPNPLALATARYA